LVVDRARSEGVAISVDCRSHGPAFPDEELDVVVVGPDLVEGVLKWLADLVNGLLPPPALGDVLFPPDRASR
jgi:hypothetical protein